MTYTHLSQSERYQVQALKACNFSLRRITAQLRRSASTIAREIARAGVRPSHHGDAAHALAIERHAKCRNARTIAPERWYVVHSYLRQYLSTEQVCGRLKLEGVVPVSHESIYQHIYRDKAQGGDLASYLRPHKVQCLTLTFKKGKKFADHAFFGRCLDADVYFAHPYHSWERETNENTNGLLRQFFPKAMSFENLCDQDVDVDAAAAAYRLNHRPRKCLGYRTPHEVFHSYPVTSLY